MVVFLAVLYQRPGFPIEVSVHVAIVPAILESSLRGVLARWELPYHLGIDWRRSSSLLLSFHVFGSSRIDCPVAISIMWQAISPRAPVPWSHQPRHAKGAFALYPTSGAGPTHCSQSSQAGTFSLAGGLENPCGQIGRFVQV